MIVSAAADVRFASGPRSLRRIGGWAVAASSASIVLVSFFYVLSPLAAIDQAIDVAPAAAAAASVDGAATMRLAGAIGIFGDLVLALGALLLMFDAARKNLGAAAAGWGAIALAALVFEIVDVVFGFALPVAARDGGDLSAFLALRNVYAALFLAGTAAFGLGAALALGCDPGFGRALRITGMALGALAIAASLLTLLGAPLGAVVGGCVGAGALLFTLIGVMIARAPVPET